MLALADAIQADYERRKQAEAALDYDDLIVKTQHLLSQPGAAAWVLYKLDGGIDHILVDEAQDTNPEQWSIVESLAAGVLRRRRRSESCARCSRSATRSSRSTRSRAPNPARFGEVGSAFRQRAAAWGSTGTRCR